MRILFDHCVPRRLRRVLPGHEISTTFDRGWSDLQNGKLLALAALHFDVVITVDQNLRHQQNLATLPVAVLVLVGKSSRLADLEPLAPAILAALEILQPRTVVEIR
jgi:predicted nuclease of predicted toxin-antitoxin system